MTLEQTLATCHDRHIRVTTHRGKLRLRPARAIDAELLEALRRHKLAIIALLTVPDVGDEGLPTAQCRGCGSPNWWTSNAFPGWHCSYCVERPEPFRQGRIVVVCGGEWGRQ